MLSIDFIFGGAVYMTYMISVLFISTTKVWKRFEKIYAITLESEGQMKYFITRT